MDKFKVKHVIISMNDDAQPKLMSLHLPIDNKMRVHTITPNMSLFAEVMNKIMNHKPVELTGEYVQLECPTYYALFPDDKYKYIGENEP